MNQLPAPTGTLINFVLPDGAQVKGYNRSDILGNDQYRDMKGNPIAPIGWIPHPSIHGV